MSANPQIDVWQAGRLYVKDDLALSPAGALVQATQPSTDAAFTASKWAQLSPAAYLRSRFYQPGLANVAAGNLGTAPNIAAVNLSAALTVIRIECDLLLDAITTGGNMTVQVKVNGTQLIGLTVLTSLTAGTPGLTALIFGRLYVEATGAGGSVTYQGQRLPRSAAGAITTADDVSAGVAVNLAGGLLVSLDAAMTANAGNIIRARGVFEQVA